MRQSRIVILLASAFLTMLTACAGNPDAKQTGFLSTYSNLKPINDDRMRYVSPTLHDYDSFIIEPVQLFVPPKKLSYKEQGEVTYYFRTKFAELLEKEGVTITSSPGPGVARVRLALTDVTESTWWMKVHPASRAAGAGTGGAAMEGEVVDSVSGRQLASVVQASPGNQFDVASFSTVDDVKSAIDKWVAQAAKRFAELRADSR